jgi:hypothetical protein
MESDRGYDMLLATRRLTGSDSHCTFAGQSSSQVPVQPQRSLPSLHGDVRSFWRTIYLWTSIIGTQSEQSQDVPRFDIYCVMSHIRVILRRSAHTAKMNPKATTVLPRLSSDELPCACVPPPGCCQRV